MVQVNFKFQKEKTHIRKFYKGSRANQIEWNFNDLYQFSLTNKNNLMASPIDTIQTINDFFGSQIIDESLISKYELEFQCSVFDDIKKVLIANKKQRQETAQLVAKRISQIYTIKLTKCLNFLESKKRTQITQFWTNLLIPKEENRSIVQKFRMKLLLKLRKNQEITPEQVAIVESLYQLVSQNNIHKTGQDNEFDCQSGEIKTILISFKKMMGTGKQEKIVDTKVKKAKRKAYLCNVDIKQIIFESLMLIENRPLRTKLEMLLNEKKNKNWFGPNLYKFFQNEEFTTTEIKEISRALEKINLEEFPLNTSQQIMKRTLKKIIYNLSFLFKSDNTQQTICQTPKQYRDQDLLDLPQFLFSKVPTGFLPQQQEQMKEYPDENIIIKQEDHLFESLCMERL